MVNKIIFILIFILCLFSIVIAAEKEKLEPEELIENLMKVDGPLGKKGYYNEKYFNELKERPYVYFEIIQKLLKLPDNAEDISEAREKEIYRANQIYLLLGLSDKKRKRHLVNYYKELDKYKGIKDNFRVTLQSDILYYFIRNDINSLLSDVTNRLSKEQITFLPAIVAYIRKFGRGEKDIIDTLNKCYSNKSAGGACYNNPIINKLIDDLSKTIPTDYQNESKPGLDNTGNIETDITQTSMENANKVKRCDSSGSERKDSGKKQLEDSQGWIWYIGGVILVIFAVTLLYILLRTWRNNRG